MRDRANVRAPNAPLVRPCPLRTRRLRRRPLPRKAFL